LHVDVSDHRRSDTGAAITGPDQSAAAHGRYFPLQCDLQHIRWTLLNEPTPQPFDNAPAASTRGGGGDRRFGSSAPCRPVHSSGVEWATGGARGAPEGTLMLTITTRTGDYYGDGSSNHISETRDNDGQLIAALYVFTDRHY